MAYIRRLLFASIVIISALAVVLGRIISALTPLRSDRALYMYIGQAWHSGDIPYLDIWESKPPGMFALHAGLAEVSLGNVFGLAVVEGVFVGLAILGVFLLARRLGLGTEISLTALLAAAFILSIQMYSERGGFTEHFLVAPAVFSMLAFCAAQAKQRHRYLLLAGVLAGVAFLFKPVGLAPLLAQTAFVSLGVLRGRLSPRTALHAIASLWGGLALSLIPLSIYFAYHGALGEALYASVLYNLSYAGGGHYSMLSTAWNLVWALQPTSALMALAGLGLVLSIPHIWRDGGMRAPDDRRPLERNDYLPLFSLWFLADVAGVLAGGRGYPHYFLALAGSVPILAALGHAYLTEGFRVETSEMRRWIMRLAVPSMVLAPLATTLALDVAVARQVRLDEAHHTAERAAEIVSAESRPGDTMFTVGYLPHMYLLAGLRSPLRYPDVFHVQDFPEARRIIGEEILRELRQELPTFIVDNGPPSLWHEQPALKAFYDEVMSLVKRSCPLLTEQGDYRVFDCRR